MSDFQDDDKSTKTKFDPRVDPVNCPKCKRELKADAEGVLKCVCGMQGRISPIIVTYIWGCTKTHGLSDWHFFESIWKHSQFKDRAFGIPICSKLQKRIILSPNDGDEVDGEILGPFRRVPTSNDEHLKPVFRVVSTPRNAVRCRHCQEIVDTFEFPKSYSALHEQEGDQPE